MSLVTKFWRAISGGWLIIRLAGSLTSFLVWFGWQIYTNSAVLLISFIWALLAVLLLIQQSLFWNVSNLKIAQIPENLQAINLKNKLQIKFLTEKNLDARCLEISKLTQKYPTHRDLAINQSLCLSFSGKNDQSALYMARAKAEDPNNDIFQIFPPLPR